MPAVCTCLRSFAVIIRAIERNCLSPEERTGNDAWDRAYRQRREDSLVGRCCHRYASRLVYHLICDFTRGQCLYLYACGILSAALHILVCCRYVPIPLRRAAILTQQHTALHVVVRYVPVIVGTVSRTDAQRRGTADVTLGSTGLRLLTVYHLHLIRVAYEGKLAQLVRDGIRAVVTEAAGNSIPCYLHVVSLSTISKLIPCGIAIWC